MNTTRHEPPHEHGTARRETATFVNTYTSGPKNVVQADVISSLELLADSATAAAVAAGGAAVVNKVVGEIGATKRHRMSEETKRLEIEARRLSGEETASDEGAIEPG
jgi:hypothetical protein